jgi:hypothetical protein
MNCTNCKTELKPVFDRPQRRADDWSTQYENALAIEISGGYGMFFDQIHARGRDLTAILCHDCAHAFVKSNLFIRELLAKEMSGPLVREVETYGHMHSGTDFGREGHGHE